ncbi:MAG: glycosyltransferase family 2 protein [Dehalococcoidia bacterium]|nr:glycosyltransferase family 2 protein [Dehalococcoidia bacterium]
MRATVDIVIPVYNEEKDLPRSIDILTRFLRDNLENSWSIIIADNGSTDNTLSIAEMLSNKYPGVTCVPIPQKGRGRALRHVWMESTGDIVSYMDVDLSTDLNHIPELIKAIEDGCHIAIGSRLAKGARVKRSLKREFISRSYSTLIRAMFFTPFRDAQCGFKALSRDTVKALVPLVKDNNWFFDSELLIIANSRGFRIKEIPVYWEDDPDSRVRIIPTAWEDVKGLLRLRFGGIPDVVAPGLESRRDT